MAAKTGPRGKVLDGTRFRMTVPYNGESRKEDRNLVILTMPFCQCLCLFYLLKMCKSFNITALNHQYLKPL